MYIIKIKTEHQDKSTFEKINKKIIKFILKKCEKHKIINFFNNIIYDENNIYIYLKNFINKKECNRILALFIILFDIRHNHNKYSSYISEIKIINNNDKDNDIFLLKLTIKQNNKFINVDNFEHINKMLLCSTIKPPVNLLSLKWSNEEINRYITDTIIGNENSYECINISHIGINCIIGRRITKYFDDIASVIEEMFFSDYDIDMEMQYINHKTIKYEQSSSEFIPFPKESLN